MQQGPIAPTVAIPFRQLQSKVFDHLFPILSTLIVKHIFLDALANIPFCQANLRVDINSNTLACIVDNAANIRKQNGFILFTTMS